MPRTKKSESSASAPLSSSSAEGSNESSVPKEEKKSKKAKAEDKEEQNKIVMTERFDQDRLAHIVKNEAKYKALLTRWADSDEDLFAPAREMLKYSKNGEVQVDYTQNNNFGRYFARGGRSMQGLARELRHSVAENFYYDADMKNAHPKILAHLCAMKRKEIEEKKKKKEAKRKYDSDDEVSECDASGEEESESEEFKTPYLDDYVQNRDKHLSELPCTRDAAKQVFLAVVNGGEKDYNKVVKESKKKDKIADTAFLTEFKKEMKKVHQRFAADDPEAFAIVRNKRIKEGKDYNHEAAFMNTLLCDFENKVLMCMYEFYKKPKDAVLCFDGIMLKKSSFEDENAFKKSLKKCSAHIEKKLGIEMEIACKPMTEGFDFKHETIAQHKDVVRENPEHEIDPKDEYVWLDLVREFAGDKVWSSLEELRSAMTPKMRRVYAFISGKGGTAVVKTSCEETPEILHADAIPSFRVKVMCKNDKGQFCEKKMLIKDLAREFVTYLPNYTVLVVKARDAPKKSFNLFRGYVARIVDCVDTKKFEKINRIIFDVWSRKDKNVYCWIMQFLQFIIANPGLKTQCLLLLYGRDIKQGCGKSTPVIFIGRFVIGHQGYYTPKSFEALIDKHNTTKVGRSLCFIPEVAALGSGNNKKDMITTIKDMVDNIDPQEINPKHAPMFMADDFMNFIASTNEKDSWPTNANSRKETILHVDEFLSEDTPENVKFWSDVKDPKQGWNQEAGDHFYTWLLNTKFEPDDPKYNFRVGQGLRTAFKTEIASMTGRSHVKFVTELPDKFLTTGKVNKTDKKKTTYIDQVKLIEHGVNTKFKVSRKSLYKLYCTWASEGHEGQLADSRFKDLITETGKIAKSSRGKDGDMYDIRGIFSEDLLKSFKPIRPPKKPDTSDSEEEDEPTKAKAEKSGTEEIVRK